MSVLWLWFQLMIGHAVADYALQPPNIALGKNRNAGPPPGYDEGTHGPRMPIWIMVLSAHALIHAGAVYVITGSPLLAVWQFLTHWFIDFLKCERLFNVFVDQGLHALVLLASAVVWSWGGSWPVL